MELLQHHDLRFPSILKHDNQNMQFPPLITLRILKLYSNLIKIKKQLHNLLQKELKLDLILPFQDGHNPHKYLQ